MIESDEHGLIWHISDLHFGSGGFHNPGHNMHLKNSLVSLMKSRPEKKDILLVTGDCTTNGRASEVSEVEGFLKDVDPYFRQVHLIPGNHDAWNSRNALIVLLKRCFNWLKNIFSNYKSRRKIPLDNLKIYDFSKRPYEFRDIDWGEKKIKLMLVDSTFRDRYAVAQGRFPDKAELADAYTELSRNTFDFCIMLLHHHIIRYTEPINNNFEFIKHELAMRLLNADVAKQFIKNTDIKCVLHGHKHVKEKEIMLSNNGQTLLCSTPAAFLDSLESKSHGIVGFNLFHYRNKKIFLTNAVYNQGYCCEDITQLTL